MFKAGVIGAVTMSLFLPQLCRAAGALAFIAGLALPVAAAEPVRDFRFAGIEGGELRLQDWGGHAGLVVNTAPLCGFTPQYDDLQALHDRYAERGLVVLAVPSDDFRQELASAEEVRKFCAVNFDLTIPMTEITHVRGPEAHPFYRWLAEAHGFTPAWNFNKVLIGPEGEVLGPWGSTVKPQAQAIVSRVVPLLD